MSEKNTITQKNLSLIPELLAPAGNIEALHAAVRAGANAVYLGLNSFNARQGADNFTVQTLKDACQYAHTRKVKVYITLNTIIFNDEIQSAMQLAYDAYMAGADAFIIQDLGLAKCISKHIPDAKIHISTQMNIHDEAGLRTAVSVGAKRITLARELSLPEIKNICKIAEKLGVEIECFAHGAICVCYSGQCLMSSMIGGRSANRGRCAQACRLKYELCSGSWNFTENTQKNIFVNEHNINNFKKSGKQNNKNYLQRKNSSKQLSKKFQNNNNCSEGSFLLSPKDLCTIDILPELVETGISSLKIEGRMKSAEYVFSVVKTYREALDLLKKILKENKKFEQKTNQNISNNKKQELSENIKVKYQVTKKQKQVLKEAFSRGFTTAYMQGKRDNEIMSHNRPNNRGINVGRVVQVYSKESKSNKGNKKNLSTFCKIETKEQINEGDVLEIWTNKGRSTIVVDKESLLEKGCIKNKINRKTNSLQKTSQKFLRNSTKNSTKNILENKITDFSQETSKKTSKIIIVKLNPKNNINDRYVKKTDRVFRVRCASNAFKDDQYLPKINVCGQIILKENQPLQFSVWPKDNKKYKVYLKGAIIEKARTKEITPDEVEKHIKKTGGTPFEFINLEIDMDGGVGVGFSALHQIRKQALNNLYEKFKTKRKPIDSFKDYNFAEKEHAYKVNINSGILDSRAPLEICVLATNPNTARYAKRNNIDSIYVPVLNYKRNTAMYGGVSTKNPESSGYPKNCIIMLPTIMHDKISSTLEEQKNFDIDKFLVTKKSQSKIFADSISGVVKGITYNNIVEVGPHLPVVNIQTVEYLYNLGIKTIWLFPEISLKRIREIIQRSPKDINFGIMVLGTQELMITEHCLLMNKGECVQNCMQCSRRQSKHYLKDRYGYKFPVIVDILGRNHIYNSVKLDNCHAMDEIIEAGIKKIMIDSTLMDSEEFAQAIGRVKSEIKNASNGQKNIKQNNTTTGHLFRTLT